MTTILRGPDGRVVEVDRHHMGEGVTAYMALSLGVATRVFIPAPGVALVRNERQRGRAWPTCVAREVPVSQRWTRFEGEYPWCGERGLWRWGDQDLCVEHAAQLALGIGVLGIAADGRWK